MLFEDDVESVLMECERDITRRSYPSVLVDRTNHRKYIIRGEEIDVLLFGQRNVASCFSLKYHASGEPLI